MRHRVKGIARGVVSAALVLSLSGAALAQRYGTAQQVSLPEGTVLKAELNDRLTSTSSQPGDHFTGTVDSVTSGLPSGTQVVGEVTGVQRADDRHPGIVDVEFRTLRLQDGRTYPIDGRLIGLDSNSVQRTASGRLVARGQKKNKYQFLGYGAGAGAIISALTGGSVLKGALLGALAGYAYQEINKDKLARGRYSEVSLKPGTAFGVVLDRGTVVNLAQHPYARYSSSASIPASRPGERTAGAFQRYPSSDVRVLVDGREVSFTEGQPFVVRDHLMVPLDPVLAALDLRYRYDPRSREVTIEQGRGETRFSVGENFAMVDGERVRLDEPVQRIDGTLYVPARLLEDAADVRLDWDSTDRVLRLRTGTEARGDVRD